MSNDAIYSIARAGNKLGEFNLVQIRDGLKSGKLLPSDHYWQAGMSDWKPVSELASAIADLNFELRQRAEASASQRLAEAESRRGQANPPGLPGGQEVGPPRCNAVVYVILGLAFGMIGMHNFYIGRTGRAWGQIVITATVVGVIFNFIWILCELAQTREDAKGRRFIGA